LSGTAVVIGASGGLGGAITRHLVASGRFSDVRALSRAGVEVAGASSGKIDIENEASIVAVAEGRAHDVACLVIATGMLHAGPVMPERALRELSADKMLRSFAVNTVGPALVLKHFVPLLVRHQTARIGIVSARVGSISDNRSGGWYGYRASKAALNMIVKCAAIELQRSRPKAICVGLHPGTVNTDLSQPFQRSVPPEKLFTPDYAAAAVLRTLEALEVDDTGKCFAWNGATIAP
jgi:NAD(P)-dependent dehydrogenase (short-subunit alcohol dehydrogenase family)